MPEITIFLETERFVRTYRNIQCFRIRSVSHLVVYQHDYFAGKGHRMIGSGARLIKRGPSLVGWYPKRS